MTAEQCPQETKWLQLPQKLGWAHRVPPIHGLGMLVTSIMRSLILNATFLSPSDFSDVQAGQPEK
jgi:hypothetical protein